MILINKLKNSIINGEISPIFKYSDLYSAGIEDPNHNLSNYDKRNPGANNQKILVSRIIGQDIFYTFDEALFATGVVEYKRD